MSSRNYILNIYIHNVYIQQIDEKYKVSMCMHQRYWLDG